MEGNHYNSVACCSTTGGTCQPGCGTNGLVCPIYEYAHSTSPYVLCSVTGGYVYRGSAIAGLAGTYFFADYDCGGGQSPVFTFNYNGSVITNFTDRTGSPPGGTGEFPGIASIT